MPVDQLPLELPPEPGQPAPEPGEPLASRMRPRSAQEVLGQDHLIGSGGALRPALEGRPLQSLVLVGPPGTGKTTLAWLLAAAQSAHLIYLSAVSAGVAEVRSAVAEARARRQTGQRTVLFLDEIHHFSRTQQDSLLPHLESGLLTLIGATTENPSFQLTGALLSRVQVYELEPLGAEPLLELVRQTLGDRERGLGPLQLRLEPQAEELLVSRAGGDARVVLNALEQLAQEVKPGSKVAIDQVLGVLSEPVLRHDRAGDFHYQLLSAFIKSMRGSDADAAIYWLARLLEAGEDPLVPARRMVILASEDVGLADPGALPLAVAAHQAARTVGMPECRLALAEAAVYLALAPKSNRIYTAYNSAHQDVLEHLHLPVPLHLRNAVTARDRQRGFGRSYQYAHDDPDALVSQTHLPPELQHQRYYRPSEHGAEAQLANRVQEIESRRRK